MNRASLLIVAAATALSGALLFGAPRLADSLGSKLDSRGFESEDESMEQQIVSKEREGLEALKAAAPQRFADLTADDAVFVDAHGLASKAQVAENVIGFTLTEYTMDDVRFVPIPPNAGLIAYKLSEKGSARGKDFAAQVYVSSVWTKREDKWVCLLSQETAAK
jgi:ketosteroid isomerase-like protein